jgi:ATP-dependent DNA helicase RecG
MKIPKSESKTVEFKAAFNQDTIVSLVAFANSDGGSVYVGVRDDGRVVGVQLADESETSWVNEIKSKTAPAIVPDADRIVVNGKTVVRLHIAPLPVKPTSVQGRYYLRKGKANHLMSIAELSDMYLKSMSSSWDALPSEHSLEDISLEKVAAFAKRMNPDGPDDPMRVLRKLSLVKDGKPTNACYLAFVDDYCFGTAFQTGRFKTRSHIIDDKTFNSDILGQLDGVMAFIMKHLMGELVITGKPQHDIKYDYPVDAIREIVLNMIVHRDYRDTGMVNTIKIFDDHIEFTNAGGLPTGLTVKKIISDAYTSSPRNPKIADVFKDAGLVERYGSGIKRIIDACKAHGKVVPEFKDMGTWFRVILRKESRETLVEPGNDILRTQQKSALKNTLKSTLKNTLKNTLKTADEKLLNLIKAFPSATIPTMQEHLGITRDGVNKVLKRLKNRGALRRVGPDKGGHWEVVEDVS